MNYLLRFRLKIYLHHFITSSLIGASLLISQHTLASDNRTLTYSGRILKPDSSPLTGNTQFRFQVTSTNGSCVLWSETQTVSLGSDGAFSTNIGTGTVVFPTSGITNISAVFSNYGTTFNCQAGGTFTPTSVTDDRNLNISFFDAGVWNSITPQLPIKAVPYALYAENAIKLNGSAISSVVPVNGQVLVYNSSSGVWQPQNPSAGSVTNAASLSTGKFWQGDGSGVAQEINFNTATDARISTALTNYSSTANFSSGLTSSGAITANPTGTGAGSGGEFRFKELAANGANYVAFRAPDSITSNITWTLPAVDGSPNQVLQTNGSGVLSWATPSGGSGLTSLNSLTAATQNFAIGTAGTAPAFNSNTATHTLNIPMANTNSVTAGLISKTEYDTFSNKQAGSSELSGLVTGMVATGIIQRTAASTYTTLGTSAPLSIVASNVVLNLGTGLATSAGSLVPDFGTTAGKVAAGDDSRIVNAVQKDGSGNVAVTGALNMNNKNITNTATPVNPSDVATKAYVDGLSGSGSNFQEFNASGTWTKPATGNLIFVECWGGGGGGGANHCAGGGGGGGYNFRFIPATLVGATVTVTIGAGGSAIAYSISNSTGGDGGNSSFGSWLTAYGGGGGGSGSCMGGGGWNGLGGGGGGQSSAGQSPPTGGSYGYPGNPKISANTSFWEGAGGSTTYGAADGGMYHGGGGWACYSNSGVAYCNLPTSGINGNGIFGGGGGGAAIEGGGYTQETSGGTSTNGGNGGAGHWYTNGINGTAPGGGGGGTAASGFSSGAGAAGRCRITMF